MTHVFIAYSHRNIDFARRIESDLLAYGYRVWRDESAGVQGDNWKCEVTRALDMASVMVVIVSPDSVLSRNVDFEVEYALQMGLPIVGIQIGNYDQASFSQQRLEEPPQCHLKLIDDAIEFIFVEEGELDQQNYEQTFTTLARAIDQSQQLMFYLKQLASLHPRMSKVNSRQTSANGPSCRLAMAI